MIKFVELSKQEIGTVAGGNFFREIGKGLHQVNQAVDSAARNTGKFFRDASQDFQAGREEARRRKEEEKRQKEAALAAQNAPKDL